MSNLDLLVEIWKGILDAIQSSRVDRDGGEMSGVEKKLKSDRDTSSYSDMVRIIAF